MPPKKQQQKGGDKKKAGGSSKSVEDKTFGMKNKNKSAKVQRYVQQVQSQAKHNAEQVRKMSYVFASHVSNWMWVWLGQVDCQEGHCFEEGRRIEAKGRACGIVQTCTDSPESTVWRQPQVSSLPVLQGWSLWERCQV